MFAISLSLISIKFPVKVTGTNISDFENLRSLGIYGKFEIVVEGKLYNRSISDTVINRTSVSSVVCYRVCVHFQFISFSIERLVFACQDLLGVVG